MVAGVCINTDSIIFACEHCDQTNHKANDVSLLMRKRDIRINCIVHPADNGQMLIYVAARYIRSDCHATVLVCLFNRCGPFSSVNWRRLHMNRNQHRAGDVLGSLLAQRAAQTTLSAAEQRCPCSQCLWKCINELVA